MATDVSMHHNAESASVLSVSLASLAKMIDHSLLHPTMTDTEIMTGLDIAKAYRAATVCVKPYATALASRELQGTGVLVCTVIGFPHGNSTPAIKVLEAKEAVELGAKEIDMVINIGKALSGDWDYVTDEIRQINDAVTNLGATLKVIFENDYLDDSHIIKLCQICSDIDVAFVKTSTGYGFVKRSTGQYSYDGATAHPLETDARALQKQRPDQSCRWGADCQRLAVRDESWCD